MKRKRVREGEGEGGKRNGERDNGMGKDGGMGGRDSSDGEIWILEGKSEIQINLFQIPQQLL